MTRMDNAFPSKYLKAPDLQGKIVNVVMDRVEQVNFQNGDTGWILFFQGKNKGMILNKTNNTAICNAYGPESNDWTGKPVSLNPGMTNGPNGPVATIFVSVPQGQTQSAPDPIPYDNEGCSDTPDDWA